jgi:electron transfer flavoprotein alpha subunit
VNTQHALFGGAMIATARFTGEAPHIFVIRAKSFAAEPGGGGAAAVVPAATPEVGATNGAAIKNRHAEERSGPKLDEASIVVSGGRGLGAAENYALIEELAKLLGGAAGASRAIVDAGWVPYSHQVGQTGKTVKPTVYLACGISGATQHMVGMKGSKNIIAVNKDRDAPIFSIADLGIVGDVHKVLPALIAALKSRS